MAAPQSSIRLISGKGGVGKTVVATAMAVAEARRGRRVLLVELNGHDRVAALLGVEPVGYALREVYDDLSVVDINRQDAIHEYVLLVLKFEALYRAVFENRLVRHFVRLVPSLGELVSLGKIWYHAQEQVRGRRRFDLIVVDAPATGHAIALLQAPGAVRAMMPPGPLRDNARLICDMLTAPAQTALHAVLTPEDMPVTEALALQAAATAAGVAVGTAVANRCRAPTPTAAAAALAAAATGDPALRPLEAALRGHEGRRAQGERELARLPEPPLRLPELAQPQLDAAAVQALAAVLAPACAAGRFGGS